MFEITIESCWIGDLITTVHIPFGAAIRFGATKMCDGEPYNLMGPVMILDYCKKSNIDDWLMC